MVTAQQAYAYVLQQERLGNYQAAYETLVDLQHNYPNYLDVPMRLYQLQQRGLTYTGMQSFFYPKPFQYEKNLAKKGSGKNRALLVVGLAVSTIVLIAAVAAIIMVVTVRKTDETSKTVAVASATSAPNVEKTGIILPPKTTVVIAATTRQTTVSATVAITTLESTTIAPTTTPEPTSTPEPTTTPMPTPIPIETQDPDELDSINRIFNNLPKGAHAIVILPTGDYVAVNENDKIPAASLIKLWIAATVLAEVENGNLNLSDTYILKKADQVSGTGIMNQPTKVGSKFTYEDILYNMLVHSDNTAANLLIDKLGGFQKVNDYSQNSGYKDTLLQRKLGLPDANNENYTSAQDIGQFLYDLVDGYVVSEKASTQLMQILVARATIGDNSEDHALNMFGTDLPKDVKYGHLSGQNTNFRGESGFFSKTNGKPVVVVVIITGNEVQAEQAINRFIGEAWVVTSGRP
ncbi:serine hydrolase [Candidatus Chlorohelix sp.]|uniref:serine hydrolase n=1 Tax=Candidatus Chlorohelix sp. TaxID=3139201 RepID=UPI00303BBFA5